MLIRVKKFSTKSQFLKLNKRDAQTFLNFIKKKLKSENFIDKSKKVISEGQFVFFPLIENKKQIKKLIKYIEPNISFEIIHRESYNSLDNSLKTIEDILKNELPPNIFKLIPKSYDIIGHIAIIEFDRFKNISYKEAIGYKRKFAKALLITNKTVKSIYEKKGRVKGKFRLRNLKLLRGKDQPHTIYKENNCIFNLNVKKTYFSPRLAYERKRLVDYDIKDHEVIIDMFAGVGPYSIQIAKDHDVEVYSFDINPIAYKYLKKNILLNKMKGKVYAFNINAKSLLKSTNTLGNELKHKADRIIMNLPQKTLKFIDVACFLMRVSGGILHNYQFVNNQNSIELAIKNLNLALEKSFWVIEKIIDYRIVRPFSPRLNLVVVDSVIRPLNYP